MIEEILGDSYEVEASQAEHPTNSRKFLIREKNGEGRYILSIVNHPEPPPEEILKRQRSLAAKMRRPPSPEFCAVIKSSFSAVRQFIISEKPEGISLNEALLRRQILNVPEVFEVIFHLCRALEDAAKSGWPRVAIETKAIFINPESGRLCFPAPEIQAYRPVASRSSGSGSGSSGGSRAVRDSDSLQSHSFSQQSSGDEELVPATTRIYVTALAGIACELLGQPRSNFSAGNIRFQPVPTLTSDQNSVLRKAMSPGARQPYRSVQEFFEAFRGKSFEDWSPQTLAGLTVAEPEPPTQPMGDTEIGIPLPRNYQLDREILGNAFVRICKARNASGESLMLTILSNDTASRFNASRLAGWLSDLNSTESSRLLSVQDASVAPPSIFVARRLPPGRSLAETLRQQGRFTKSQVALVLAGIYQAYQELWQIENRLIASSLTQIHLSPAPPASETWQSGVEVVLDAGDVMFIGIRENSDDGIKLHFATLACQLLGQNAGNLARPSPFRFAPIPELTGHENQLLGQLSDPGRNTTLSLEAFLNEFTGQPLDSALATPAEAAVPLTAPLSIPKSFENIKPVSCRSLRLMPKSSRNLVLAIVSKTALHLGRSVSDCDFVAQFRPRSNSNDLRTRKISRQQLEIRRADPGQIRMKDIGSQNPSLLDNAKPVGIKCELPTPFSFLLAGEYAVRIKDFASRYEDQRDFANGAKDGETIGPCTIIRSLENNALPFETAWILSDIELVVDASGVIRFGQAAAGSIAARVHRWRNEFWLEAPPDDLRLAVDGRDLAPHEMVPLRSGTQLDFNGVRYLATDE